MSDEFVLRRKTWVTRIFLPLLSVVALYHHLIVEGAEHLPRQGPALLVVKHRATRDSILLSLIIYRFTRRFANYLMKGKPAGIFNGILEAAGGIKVIRPKDIHRLESRAAQKAYLQQARDLNERVFSYITWLYRQGEIVVAFPEGMLYPDRVGPIQSGLMKHTWQVEQEIGSKIPVIPIGIEYESFNRPRARAFFRVGSPIYSTVSSDQSQMIAAISQHLGELSGLGELTN